MSLQVNNQQNRLNIFFQKKMLYSDETIDYKYDEHHGNIFLFLQASHK